MQVLEGCADLCCCGELVGIASRLDAVRVPALSSQADGEKTCEWKGLRVESGGDRRRGRWLVKAFGCRIGNFFSNALDTATAAAAATADGLAADVVLTNRLGERCTLLVVESTLRGLAGKDCNQWAIGEKVEEAPVWQPMAPPYPVGS